MHKTEVDNQSGISKGELSSAMLVTKTSQIMGRTHVSACVFVLFSQKGCPVILVFLPRENVKGDNFQFPEVININ